MLRTRTLRVWLLCLLLCLMLSGCATTEKIVYKDVPADYSLIKTSTLQDLMESSVRCKAELMNCLEEKK